MADEDIHRTVREGVRRRLAASRERVTTNANEDKKSCAKAKGFPIRSRSSAFVTNPTLASHRCCQILARSTKGKGVNMKNDTTKKKTEITTEFEDGFSKPSPNKNFWNFAHEPNDWDKFDPTTASDKEVAEMVAGHFASSQFYLERHLREDSMPLVHSLVRTSPDRYCQPTKEAWEKPRSSKAPGCGDERKWIIETLLAGFGVAQLVELPEDDYEITINWHYASLQDAREQFARRQADKWRELVAEHIAAGQVIPNYIRKSDEVIKQEEAEAFQFEGEGA
jgi:hypothetical protein